MADNKDAGKKEEEDYEDEKPTCCDNYCACVIATVKVINFY